MTIETALIRGIKGFMESKKYYQKQIAELDASIEHLKSELRAKGMSDGDIAEALSS